MKESRQFSCLLFFFIAINIFPPYAFARPPAGIYLLDELVFEFRGELERKIKELSENYIAQEGNNTLIFTSHETVECAHSQISSGHPLAKLQYLFELKDESLIERGQYTDCFNAVTLKEITITKGSNLTPLTFEQFKKGQRPIGLKEGELQRQYILQNGEGIELFSLFTVKTSDGENTILSLLGNRFCNIRKIKQTEREAYYITYYPYSFTYSLPYQSWGVTREFSTYKNSIVQRPNSSDFDYLGASNQRISRQSFQNTFSNMVLGGAFNSLKQFLSYHLYTMPSTDFTSAGTQNSRMLDELRMAYIQLLSNTSINLVQNLVKNYIDAIEKGQIRIDDRRPKD